MSYLLNYLKFGKLLAVLLILAISHPVSAQSVRSLFSIDESVRYRPASDEYNRVAIQLDPSIRETPPAIGEILEIPVGADSFEFRVLNVREFMPGILSFTGVDANRSGRYFAISLSEDSVTGLMQLLPEGAVYHIKSQPESGPDVLARMRPDRLDILTCGVNDESYSEFALSEEHPLQRARQNLAGLQALTAPTAGPEWQSIANDPSGLTTIDVMIVYTPNARSWASANPNSPGSIELAVAQAMNLSQQALDVSEVGIEMRLVYVHETEYAVDTEFITAGLSGVHLRRITSSPTFTFGSTTVSGVNYPLDGYMDEVHVLRDQYGVDVVALLALVNDTGGLAWRIGNFGGSPQLAFSLNRIQQTHTGYTLVHEIGHNMGKSHGRIQGSQAADAFGGVHRYSVGWLFQATEPFGSNADRPTGRNTVMNYGVDGSLQYPGFSNPELSWEGGVTGTVDDPIGPADNARSLLDMAGPVSSYRTTRVDPPALSVSIPDASLVLAPGEQQTIHVAMSNTGLSNLMWSAEVEVLSNTSATGAPTYVFDLPELDIIHQNDFESPLAINPRWFPIQYEYRTFSATRRFQITRVNPRDGEQHLRMPHISLDGPEVFTQVSLPLFERTQTGAYSVEFDMAVRGGAGTRYDVYINDVTRAGMAAGMVITQGNLIFTRFAGSDGRVAFFSDNNQTAVQPGQYHRFRITVNPETGLLYYFKDGELLNAVPQMHPRTFDHIQFLRQNTSIAEDYLDIDNLRIIRHYDSYRWLGFERHAGNILPGENGTLTVNFDASGVPPGIYNGAVILRSNDPENQETRIPVRLNVGPVSVDRGSELPGEVTLAQNFPNPFNPQTTIRFSLPESMHTALRVYDTLGRQVATLVNEVMPAGMHNINFDGTRLSSGVYMYSLETASGTITRRMLLIK
jgi:hypothetical protein